MKPVMRTVLCGVLSILLCVQLVSIVIPGGIIGTSSAVAQSSCSATKSHLVPWSGGRWFLSGVNVPWQNGGYGADFATVEEWNQHTYTSAQTEAMFAALKNAGVNSVRWWIFTDGRGAPEFSANSGGSVTGLDANLLPSMEDAIKLAARYNIYIVFNLWSFEMAFGDGNPSYNGEHGGGHRDLIVNATKRQSFIDKAIIPMLRHPIGGTSYTIGTHPNVLGWDIINEPEWIISESGSVNGQVPQAVSLAEMQRFVALISGAIHRNSNQLVTVGSASMKWNSDSAPGAAGNWWHDRFLTPYDAQGYLDFYQIHYYEWMNGDGVSWSYSPVVNSWQQAGFDKPTVVGELPAVDGGTGRPLADLLQRLLGNCYAGAWAWSYEGVDDQGSWSNAAAAYTSFNRTNASLINITSTPPATATTPPVTATTPPATATTPPATATTPPATATTPPATPTTAPTPTQVTRLIYTDALISGWQNWSWSAGVNLQNTTPVRRGSKSISVRFTEPWGGFYLHTDTPIDLSKYKVLRFAIHGGTSGKQQLKIWLRDPQGNIKDNIMLPQLRANRWQYIEVPLSGLSQVSDIIWQDTAGVAQPHFYIDDIRVLGTSTNASASGLEELTVSYEESLPLVINQ